MLLRNPVTALVLGAVSRDLDRARATGDDTGRPGGVVTYAGTALARLGARVRVVTRVHKSDADALLAPLHAEGVAVTALPSERTTTYELDYSGSVDLHELLAVSDPIEPGDVPADWRKNTIVQLGPLHGRDILPETIATLSGLIGIDVQGLVREPDRRLDLAAMLEHVHVVQVSEEELPSILDGESISAFVRRYAVEELIVTRGARGALLLTAGGEADIPAEPSSGRFKVGAGDVFLACYLLQRVRGAKPADAAEAATRACAAKIEHGQVPSGFSADGFSADGFSAAGFSAEVETSR